MESPTRPIVITVMLPGDFGVRCALRIPIQAGETVSDLAAAILRRSALLHSARACGLTTFQIIHAPTGGTLFGDDLVMDVVADGDLLSIFSTPNLDQGDWHDVGRSAVAAAHRRAIAVSASARSLVRAPAVAKANDAIQHPSAPHARLLQPSRSACCSAGKPGISARRAKPRADTADCVV